MVVALPAWLAGVRTTGSHRERGQQTLSSGAVGGGAISGHLLNRIGLLLRGVGSLWWLGIAVVAIATVTHVAASSSARVVKMSVHLTGGGPTAG